MDKPIYVKITKQPESDKAWYKDAYLQELVYPVTSYWSDEFWQIANTNKLLYKSDCEVVPTLQPESQEQPNGGVMTYASMVASTLENKSPFGAAFDGYLLGYKDGKSEVRAVPEGQHLISTQQLKEMHDEVNGHLIMNPIAYKLEKWFPTVFVPAKTYKVKLEIDNLSQEEYTACITHLKDVADTAKGWRKSVILEETEK